MQDNHIVFNTYDSYIKLVDAMYTDMFRVCRILYRHS